MLLDNNGSKPKPPKEKLFIINTHSDGDFKTLNGDYTYYIDPETGEHKTTRGCIKKDTPEKED